MADSLYATFARFMHRVSQIPRTPKSPFVGSDLVAEVAPALEHVRLLEESAKDFTKATALIRAECDETVRRTRDECETKLTVSAAACAADADAAYAAADAVRTAAGERVEQVILENQELREQVRILEQDNANKVLRLMELEKWYHLATHAEVEDFFAGCQREASFQQIKWGHTTDVGKEPADWFWLIGYLAGKALAAAIAADRAKALHHCISVAAVCLNWHARLSKTLPPPKRKKAIEVALGDEVPDMRPGIDTTQLERDLEQHVQDECNEGL